MPQSRSLHLQSILVTMFLLIYQRTIKPSKTLIPAAQIHGLLTLTNTFKSRNKSIAFGGYLEPRSIYNRSNYFNSKSALETRNIHLGIDLWCAAETPVLAAFDGVVHSFKDNTNHGDYGPTLLLKHCIDNVEFYTLYGHLSRSSIKDLSRKHSNN